MTPRPIIIDCDPGQDDTVALLLALGSADELEILGICAVAGNVPLSMTERNARRVRELAGRADLPVYAGCPRPLVRPLETASNIHGPTGIEGAELPEPSRPAEAQHAVDFVIETLLASKQPITLATLGPMTNVAVAIVKEPAILPKIREVVMMGGAIGLGNITPAAEFNVYADPHAAHVVFESGVTLTMIGLDVTHKALATPARIEAIRAVDNPAALAVAGILARYAERNAAAFGHAGAPLHDPCVIARILRPELFSGRHIRVDVEIVSRLTEGRTVCDMHGRSGRPANATVLETIDAEGFFTLLTERLARLPKRL
jgi:purine nucleosidase